MDILLRASDRACQIAISVLVRIAVFVDGLRLTIPRRVRRWRGSMRKLWRQWAVANRRDLAQPFVPRGVRPWNRTAAHVEEEVVRLHVASPLTGGGTLAYLVERVLGISMSRETVRKIVLRNGELIFKLTDAEKRRRRRITVRGPRQLWGLDLTLVWVLGFIPVWVMGVVDYHGSRIVAFERLPWPTGAQIGRVLENAIAVEGAPRRLLTDRAPVFMGLDFQLVLAAYGTDHGRTRPAHPWTNGRIERVFRTFKETVFGLFWLVASHDQLDRFCADFTRWHNRDRPHMSNSGRTPNEVWHGRPAQRAGLRTTYVDGRLPWWDFG